MLEFLVSDILKSKASFHSKKILLFTEISFFCFNYSLALEWKLKHTTYSLDSLERVDDLMIPSTFLKDFLSVC